MRFYNRMIALLLTACIMLGILGISAFAADSDEQSSQPKGYGGVPLYFQTDYPDTPFGHGTVATSGCTITCLAMVASYLTGKEYKPDVLAEGFGGSTAENNIERMENASASLDLPAYEKLVDWQDALVALYDNKIIIALYSDSSEFTDSQHCVVLTGISDDDKIFVNDPFEPNYSRWELQSRYENGFDKNEIAAGFSGGWAYQKPFTPDSSSDESTPDPDPIEESTPSETPSYNSVPLYFQDDYPDVRYGSGTIASSGCSVTSLAMVATYMTKHTYTPDMLADYIADYNGSSHIQRLEYASDLLQLPWSRAENFHDAIRALREGMIVIALMNQKSLFTSGQHFIVLTGVNDVGKIMVNDSKKSNYDVWNLKNAFENGFTEGDILKGFSGAWIYDPTAMTEDPFIYDKSSTCAEEQRYPEIQLTDGEKDLLARMIWVEARGESFEGQQAIAEVVFNRFISGNFQSSIKGIIYAKGQFNSTAFLDDAEPTRVQYEAIDRALHGPYVLPTGVMYFARSAVNDLAWGQIGGHVFCYQE